MGHDSLYSLSKKIGRLLVEKGDLMAAAESCTGGWIAKVMTDVPGSSDWFDCGFVTYSNQSKSALLGVSDAILKRYGAVSEEVVRAMVSGALAASNAQVAVAVSGIAGPAGGTKEKPVGTVWFAWERSGFPCVSAKHSLYGDRESVRRKTVMIALQGIQAVYGA